MSPPMLEPGLCHHGRPGHPGQTSTMDLERAQLGITAHGLHLELFILEPNKLLILESNKLIFLHTPPAILPSSSFHVQPQNIQAKGKADLIMGKCYRASKKEVFGVDRAEMGLLLLWIKFVKYIWIYGIFK